MILCSLVLTLDHPLRACPPLILNSVIIIYRKKASRPAALHLSAYSHDLAWPNEHCNVILVVHCKQKNIKNKLYIKAFIMDFKRDIMDEKLR